MATYLVVANQTAISPELTAALLEKTKEEPQANFFLLVPATQLEHLVIGEEGQAREIAARRAGKALTHLTDAGIHIVGAGVGAASPEEAVGMELRARPNVYDGIIISTFPKGASRWLETGAGPAMEQRFSLPVTHVTAELHHKS